MAGRNMLWSASDEKVACICSAVQLHISCSPTREREFMQKGRPPLRMAEVSRLSGVSDQTIRFYERKGLISPVGRTPKGHRIYSSESVQSLRIIKAAQSMGFSLEEISTLLQAKPGLPLACRDLHAVLEEKLRLVRELSETLVKVEARVLGLLHCCDVCDGGGCPLRVDLSDQDGIKGQRRCICLGGEPGTRSGLDPETARYAS